MNYNQIISHAYMLLVFRNHEILLRKWGFFQVKLPVIVDALGMQTVFSLRFFFFLDTVTVNA